MEKLQKIHEEILEGKRKFFMLEMLKLLLMNQLLMYLEIQFIM